MAELQARVRRMTPYLQWLADNLAPTTDRGAALSMRTCDTVLGYAAGYDMDAVAPFVRSLRSVFSGRIILIVGHDATLRAYLSTHGIEVETAPQWKWRWRPHPVVERFSAFADVLDHRADIRNVIMTDVRDVVFQSDPFSGMEDELQFFLEADGRSLGEHPFNLKHLRRLVGDRLARELSDKACVCVGVVAGPAAAVRRFCRILLLLCAIPRSRAGGAFGADQAACNLIAHLDLAGGRIRANYGRVATIGLTPARQLSLVDGRIRNPDGTQSPIVHQYDRIGFLADHVQSRWGLRGDARRLRQRVRSGTQHVFASVLRRLPEWR